MVVDGRFKGGWISRAYGKPDEGVDALHRVA
jgi:N-formylglutamate amidohydrolase